MFSFGYFLLTNPVLRGVIWFRLVVGPAVLASFMLLHRSNDHAKYATITLSVGYIFGMCCRYGINHTSVTCPCVEKSSGVWCVVYPTQLVGYRQHAHVHLLWSLREHAEVGLRDVGAVV